MTRFCLLLMKSPHSDEEERAVFGPLWEARGQGQEAALYLLGDGVLCAKKDSHQGKGLKGLIEKGIEIKASTKDLRARAISKENVEPGILELDDLEGEFVTDMMERSQRVMSW